MNEQPDQIAKIITWEEGRIPNVLMRIPNVLITPLRDSDFDNQDLLSQEQYIISFLENYRGTLLGIAANQLEDLVSIGDFPRICAVFDGDNIVSLVNPHIIEYSGGFIIGEEGCASLPGTSVEVLRHSKVVVRHEDIDGHRFSTFEDITSVVVQHEIDHLDGILILHRGTDQEYAIKDK